MCMPLNPRGEAWSEIEQTVSAEAQPLQPPQPPSTTISRVPSEHQGAVTVMHGGKGGGGGNTQQTCKTERAQGPGAFEGTQHKKLQRSAPQGERFSTGFGEAEAT